MIDVEEVKEFINNNGKVTLRPSSIQQFLNCPAQWFRGAVLRDYQKPSAAAEAGSSLHKGAEVGYEEKIKTGRLPPLSVVTDAVNEEWKQRNEELDITYNKGETFENFQTELIGDISTYYTKIMPETQPIAVEKHYEPIKLEHPIFSNIGGTIDIDLEGGLADIKRTKVKSSAPKYVLQLSTYALIKQHNGALCVNADIHNVVRGKDVNVFKLDINIDYAKFVINEILDTTREFFETGNPRLFRGSSPNTNYLCSPKWCGYWDKCEYVKHIKGVNDE